MELKYITNSNREAWNEVTPIHQKARKVNLKEKFKVEGFSILDKYETEKLVDIPIKGKHVAQLCCNNGSETLSLINLGADSGVGFDISDEAIKEALELAEISGLNCDFIRTDVYDIGEEYYNQFDFIYITIGALTWLPDLNIFFSIVSKMLKDSGKIMIYDSHPITDIFLYENEEGFDSDNPLKIVNSYFRTEPWIDNDGIDYIGKTRYKSETTYSFTYRLSDVFNAVIRNGIVIEEFYENPHHLSPEHAPLEKGHKIPLSYILIGQKQ
ncbi:MAG: class I SAM-dependent methyltransferase [candidate division Zixibacteria bacterium]|nr:class I SAM-dependent methyltransferase [candidate division Zixibacteria bacterium]